MSPPNRRRTTSKPTNLILRMRNFFRRLKHAWLFPRTIQYRDVYPGFWDNADARWLSGMFGTVHGRKLSQLLTNFVCEQQMNACMPNLKEPDFSRGVSYGAQAAIAFMESHMKFSEVPADSGAIEEAELTGAPDLAQYRP